MDEAKIDAIIDHLPPDTALDDALEKIPELKNLSTSDHQIAQLLDHATQFDRSRRTALNPVATLIAPGKLTDYVPVQKAPGSGPIVTQFDGPTCESLGLLKIDLLGLKELTHLANTVRQIRNQSPDFDPNKTALDDPDTFALFGRGETADIFAFQSEDIRSFLSHSSNPTPSKTSPPSTRSAVRAG